MTMLNMEHATVEELESIILSLQVDLEEKERTIKQLSAILVGFAFVSVCLLIVCWMLLQGLGWTT